MAACPDRVAIDSWVSDFVAARPSKGGGARPLYEADFVAIVGDPALADMTVVMTDDGAGPELGRAKGNVHMGNPVNAAMWLAQALKKDGIALKTGDLLNLGGFIPPAPTQAGTAIRIDTNRRND